GVTPAAVRTVGVTLVRARLVTDRLASVRAPVVYPFLTRLVRGVGASFIACMRTVSSSRYIAILLCGDYSRFAMAPVWAAARRRSTRETAYIAKSATAMPAST